MKERGAQLEKPDARQVLEAWLYDASVASIFSSIEYDSRLRKRSLAMAKQILREQRTDLRLRLIFAKVIVAHLPATLTIIREIFTESSGKLISEYRFTLLCYLEEMNFIPELEQYAESVTAILTDYLRQARTNTGLATWMTAHLLSEHWPIESGARVLLSSAQRSRYAVAREIVVASLSELWPRLVGENEELLCEVRRVLQDVSDGDRSAKVRKTAERVLSSMGQSLQGA